MMQRIFLTLDVTGAMAFDERRLREAVRSLKRVANWREGQETPDPQGTLFECELESDDDRAVPVPIEVRKNLLSLSIGAYCDSGLQAALDLQAIYGEPIRAFSEESSPDFVDLAAIRTPGELAERLRLR